MMMPMTRTLLVAVLLLCGAILQTHPLPADTSKVDNSAKWIAIGQKELNFALNKPKDNNNVAKNVVLFLGDGMGVTTVTGGRMYKGQLDSTTEEETSLTFEQFTNVALSKTYIVDYITADSAATATAYLSGVKANFGTVGVDATVKRGNCSSVDAGKVTNILKWSIDEGKSVGIITNTRLTHATPASSYAHLADRNWEGDVEMAKYNNTETCKDIAQQLIDNLDLKVILGGGRRVFLLNNMTDPETLKIDRKQRADGRNLIEDWKKKRSEGGKSASYVWNKGQFDAVDPEKTDYLLGIFSPSHMDYDIDRDSSAKGEPSIAEMTRKAIQVLQKNEKGFFLMVEGGRIDHAHHDNLAKRALHEVVALDKAVAAGLELTNEKDTLTVVTADHSHVFTLGGYPRRGTDMFGKVVPYAGGDWDFPADGMERTSIMYGDGPSGPRVNLSGTDTTNKDFMYHGILELDYESHGAEDVAIYAQGPMAHLFHGVHEQNYIAHVMAYASCVGANKKHCEGNRDDDDEKCTSGASVKITPLSGAVSIMTLCSYITLVVLIQSSYV